MIQVKFGSNIFFLYNYFLTLLWIIPVSVGGLKCVSVVRRPFLFTTRYSLISLTKAFSCSMSFQWQQQHENWNALLSTLYPLKEKIELGPLFFFFFDKKVFIQLLYFFLLILLIPMNFNQLPDWSIVIEIELASLDRNEKSFFQLILTLQIWLKIDWVRTFQCETFNIRSVILKIDVLTFVFLFLKNWWSIVINI